MVVDGLTDLYGTGCFNNSVISNFKYIQSNQGQASKLVAEVFSRNVDECVIVESEDMSPWSLKLIH